MMVTNDERRRVAYKLTSMGSHYNAFHSSGFDAEPYMTDLLQTVGADGVENLCQRLAELIRPDDDFEAISQGVDREKLLALADEIDMDAGCFACVDDYSVYEYARRIREALGEK